MSTTAHFDLLVRVVAVALLAGTSALNAQVVELSGGTSTLYQSKGGMMSVHGRSYSATGGGGMINGRFYTGGQIIKSLEKSSVVLGTDNITFDLPTDIFQGGHYLTVIGAGLHTKVGDANVYGFAGETSTSFNSPFFLGTRAEKPAIILFATGKMAPQWTGATRVLIPLSTHATVIHSVAYNDEQGTKFAVAGGLGAGQLYAASSLQLNRQNYDLKLAYISSSTDFRRANVAAPLTAEPNKENVELTIRPTKWASISAGRQNFLTPVYQSNATIRSSMNQVSGNIQVAGSSISATIFQSKYAGGENVATTYSFSRAFGSRIHTQTSYLVSRPDGAPGSESLIANVHETLTPRWTISQMLNRTGTNNSFGFGGSFLSNLATLSVDYQTFYVPSRINNPFEEAVIVNAQIHVLGRLTLNGGTFVGPDGSLLYTAEAEGTISREESGAANAIPRHTLGVMLLRGRVLDAGGHPIMGAALQVDQLMVYTDSQGYFYVRERRSRQHVLAVLTDQFLDGGNYKVVSAPSEVESTLDAGVEALVVVEKIGVTGS